MDIVVQSPSATFAFANTGDEAVKSSLTGVGPAVTTKGKRTAGAVELYCSTDATKKGVMRARIGARVPLFSLLNTTDGAVVSDNVSGNGASGFAQVELTVTLPNRAGVITTSDDIDTTTGVPKTQSAANATAVSLALQIVLNAICNQGAGVLAASKALMDYTTFGSDLSNPITRGLMGLLPMDGTDRSIKSAS